MASLQCDYITMLNNLINRAVYKIFKVGLSDKAVIFLSYQTVYLGLHDIDVLGLCKERHERFLRRTGLLSHAVLQSLIAKYSSIYSSVFLFFYILLGYVFCIVCFF